VAGEHRKILTLNVHQSGLWKSEAAFLVKILDSVQALKTIVVHEIISFGFHLRISAFLNNKQDNPDIIGERRNAPCLSKQSGISIKIYLFWRARRIAEFAKN
jgi:hypothetical protein